METTFRQWKKQCLKKLDLSKKGSVDADIVHIVSFLNSSDKFFTTSSCSGRIIVIDGASESTDVQKQNCIWLFVSHQKCTSEELMCALSNSSGDAVLKFEPFVLHVQCSRLEDAQLMHSVAVNSGFRNSGLTVSKAGKIITAVRSTHGLEVPLSHQGRLLVCQSYIQYLVRVANQKMEENLRRIHRFYQNLLSAQSAVQPELQIPDNPDVTTTQEPLKQDGCRLADGGEEDSGEKQRTYTRRRRRETHKLDRCHGDTSSVQLEDCLDLFM